MKAEISYRVFPFQQYPEANRNDAKLLAATLDGIVVARPASEEEEESAEHLCLDAG